MSRRGGIDCQAFAHEGGSLEGDLEIGALTRLHDLLTEASGCLHYRINGRTGPRERPQLLVQVDGVLSLCCQRCLEPLPYRLELRSLLEFVEGEDDLSQEELEDDTRDFLPSQQDLDPQVLLEDEILLALPVAPRHEQCSLPGAMRQEEDPSAFAVLAGLRRGS